MHDARISPDNAIRTTVSIQWLTHWELAALKHISDRYWDQHVLTCDSWGEARDQIAIDGLLSTLIEKLSQATDSPESDQGGRWPLENEDQIRRQWIESGGQP